MNLLASLSALLAPAAEPDARVRDGLRRIAEQVGAPLATERTFERKLAAPVRHALDYCDGLVAALPPGIDVGRAAFASDPLVHALFASADDIAEMLGLSPALRDFLGEAESWRGEHIHALLAARPQQKAVFGVARQGELNVSDVAQRLLYFCDHTVVLPASDRETAAARLAAAAFDSLLQSFADHVDGVRAEREQLRVERGLERARMQTLRGAAPALREACQARTLAELDHRLRAHADALQPGPLLAALADHLMQPEQALSLVPVSLQVDAGGALHPAQQPVREGGTVTPISFMELVSRDRRRHAVVPVRIRCDEARAALAHMRAVRDRLLLL